MEIAGYGHAAHYLALAHRHGGSRRDTVLGPSPRVPRRMPATLVDVRWKSKENSAASSHTAAALEILRSSDPENEFPPTSTSAESARRYILFFDGGSRGNPGPGGSGAVIVSTNQVATTASIIWSAAMSSAKPTTTNNQAEYRGVLEELRAAQNHRWLPPDVVGDSQLILGQLGNTAPANESAIRRSPSSQVHHPQTTQPSRNTSARTSPTGKPTTTLITLSRTAQRRL